MCLGRQSKRFVKLDIPVGAMLIYLTTANHLLVHMKGVIRRHVDAVSTGSESKLYQMTNPIPLDGCRATPSPHCTQALNAGNARHYPRCLGRGTFIVWKELTSSVTERT